MTITQARRFLKLIDAVEEFPAENFDKTSFRRGDCRCPGGIACDLFRPFRWVSGVPSIKFRMGARALDDFFGTEENNYFWGIMFELKGDWCARANEYLERKLDELGYEIVPA